ncbi:MAG: hypothetical protein LBP35_03590 [Candidatus Ancillula trichonymphae]|nr:hypothetical protein [Candidatus Ancillula trichonymphae]
MHKEKAGGGTIAAKGGKGGYATGTLHLEVGQKLYMYTGNSGTGDSWNGGGARLDANDYKNGGGGGTDIRLTNGNWDTSAGLNSRILVAGGGGGSIAECVVRHRCWIEEWFAYDVWIPERAPHIQPQRMATYQFPLSTQIQVLTRHFLRLCRSLLRSLSTARNQFQRQLLLPLQLRPIQWWWRILVGMLPERQVCCRFIPRAKIARSMVAPGSSCSTKLTTAAEHLTAVDPQLLLDRAASHLPLL